MNVKTTKVNHATAATVNSYMAQQNTVTEYVNIDLKGLDPTLVGSDLTLMIETVNFDVGSLCEQFRSAGLDTYDIDRVIEKMFIELRFVQLAKLLATRVNTVK